MQNSSERKIEILDSVTINKIAAGEVVERPASVVKELIENAIDAGARRIEIEAMGGGISFLRVTDDGGAMSPADAARAIRRHATSKIRTADDLLTIATMGFRGEALPTIASVSRFSLTTRRAADELGTAIKITGGGEPEISETGCAPGTTVKVEDLFFNTPARKKFLKTTHTEGQKINEAVTRLALANPSIAFRFLSNNRAAVQTPGDGDLKNAIRAVYGQAAAASLLPLNFSDDGLTISGYISKPSLLRASRAAQTIVVNGRIINSKAISRALDNAYRSMIPGSGYPVAVVNIAVEPRSLDVNVHPQKTEIKFADEGRVFRAVYKSVIDAIRPVGQSLAAVAASVEHIERRYDAAPQFGGAARSGNFAAAPAGNYHGAVQDARFPAAGQNAPFPANSPLEIALNEKFAAASAVQGQLRLSESERDAIESEARAAEALAAAKDKIYERGDFSGEANYAEVDFGTAAAERGKKPRFGARAVSPDDPLAGDVVPEALGQVAKCYILARDATGLFIIDQHAAHERILYDRFAAQKAEIPAQNLIVQQILSFPAAEADLIEANKELFAQFGFQLEMAGEKEFRLIAAPADIPVSQAVEAIRQILVALGEEKNITPALLRHHIIATTACRAAIKQSDELTVRQMQVIIDELAATSRPYTCPHGRPTILRFDRDDLALMFKRT